MKELTFTSFSSIHFKFASLNSLSQRNWESLLSLASLGRIERDIAWHIERCNWLPLTWTCIFIFDLMLYSRIADFDLLPLVPLKWQPPEGFWCWGWCSSSSSAPMIRRTSLLMPRLTRWCVFYRLLCRLCNGPISPLKPVVLSTVYSRRSGQRHTLD